jgi:hypothetical protein
VATFATMLPFEWSYAVIYELLYPVSCLISRWCAPTAADRVKVFGGAALSVFVAVVVIVRSFRRWKLADSRVRSSVERP